ncbi:MAG: hypothetical protein A3G34_08485 [Candidatus Lindowbacteria bacterium RIFCSPLOWO2_12_FULL_62_27]|nr:MAG: hypothetical protein A3G34_08485 [Candidatus Lindowbacteria bacterium RIFCSPLOWO2_12_FULL_62_27]OGH62936.1 MAG: hypothetical protein A3I06_13730 [Candidatus Lindowbacteria bacterium RIFCSPLOWO2_02_FULL_62_12]
MCVLLMACNKMPPSVYVAQSKLNGMIVTSVKTVVLPLQNLTGRQDDFTFMDDILFNRITSGSIFEAIPQGDAAKVLEGRRARWFHKIDPETVKDIVKKYGADFVVAGAVTEIRRESPMALGISIRLLDGRTGDILVSVTHSLTERDDETVFGVGRADTMLKLGKRIIDASVASMENHFNRRE